MNRSTSPLEQIQKLIDSIVNDKKELKQIQTLVHAQKVRKLQELKQNHAELTKEKNRLKMVHANIINGRERVQNECRLLGHKQL